jgi:hypothetical protein
MSFSEIFRMVALRGPEPYSSSAPGEEVDEGGLDAFDASQATLLEFLPGLREAAAIRFRDSVRIATELGDYWNDEELAAERRGLRASLDGIEQAQHMEVRSALRIARAVGNHPGLASNSRTLNLLWNSEPRPRLERPGHPLDADDVLAGSEAENRAIERELRILDSFADELDLATPQTAPENIGPDRVIRRPGALTRGWRWLAGSQNRVPDSRDFEAELGPSVAGARSALERATTLASLGSSGDGADMAPTHAALTALLFRGTEDLTSVGFVRRVAQKRADSLRKRSNALGTRRPDRPSRDVDDSDEGADDGAVRLVGLADLLVVRDRLVGYEAREVAHIENILPGETRRREHHVLNRQETTVELEVNESSFEEKDQRTSERFELQSEAGKTLEESFSVEAGVQTSGRYGVTKVDTSVEAGFSQDRSQTHSIATTYAKDVIEKTVSRTSKSVRNLRRNVSLEEIKDLNLHSFSRVGAEQGYSGIYYWVDKVQELEIRHYGTRLFLEFWIPEPGVFLSGTETADQESPIPPMPALEDIQEDDYSDAVATFGAVGIEPPPSAKIQVGYTFVTTPNEADDDGKSETTKDDTITIPDGYLPANAITRISGRDRSDAFHVFITVGGYSVAHGTYPGTNEDGSTRRHPPNQGLLQEPAPGGLPVVIRLSSHYDGTAAISIRIDCNRSPRLLESWRLRTWERIKEARDRLEAEAERARRNAESVGAIPGRHPDQNRAIERDELQKWATQLLRQRVHRHSAIARYLGLPEVSPHRADELAPEMSFFSQAFEWDQMTYFLVPYFWGRRRTWRPKQLLTGSDPQHTAFLRAGGCRLLVTVSPGFERRVVAYMQGAGLADLGSEPEELPNVDEATEDTLNLWIELLRARKPGVVLGSGTLSVVNDEEQLDINDDSLWAPGEVDVGRTLYIGLGEYTITGVDPEEHTVTLDRGYDGDDSDSESFALESVRIGQPWEIRVATSMVVLDEGREPLQGYAPTDPAAGAQGEFVAPPIEPVAAPN